MLYIQIHLKLTIYKNTWKYAKIHGKMVGKYQQRQKFYAKQTLCAQWLYEIGPRSLTITRSVYRPLIYQNDHSGSKKKMKVNFDRLELNGRGLVAEGGGEQSVMSVWSNDVHKLIKSTCSVYIYNIHYAAAQTEGLPLFI